MDTDLYNAYWLALVYRALPTEGKRDLLEAVEDCIEFYRSRAEFNPPPYETSVIFTPEYMQENKTR